MAWVIFFALILGAILMVRSSHKRQQERERQQREQERREAYESTQANLEDLFHENPLINTHRVTCPDCGKWATLMINTQGIQRWVCDDCGHEHFSG
ncbi:MAG: hypothetical protein M1493_13745 [Firmicutes bacterium]|jgi:transposase-like protein|nr:hypothetical protein [Bacillota bacterium]